jgi:hypothetical protein
VELGQMDEKKDARETQVCRATGSLGPRGSLALTVLCRRRSELTESPSGSASFATFPGAPRCLPRGTTSTLIGGLTRAKAPT